jgi:hypothetical protein
MSQPYLDVEVVEVSESDFAAGGDCWQRVGTVQRFVIRRGPDLDINPPDWTSSLHLREDHKPKLG